MTSPHEDPQGTGGTYKCLSIVAPATLSAGAGFAISRGGAVWIMTAAHVPLCSSMFSDLSSWPREIQVRTKEQILTVPLFDSATGMPTFNYRRDGEGKLHDMIALRWTNEDLQTVIYPWRPEYTCRKGSTVSGWGFPNATLFPADNPSRFESKIKSLEWNLATTEDEIVPGFSGGPLLSSEGVVLGMMFGSQSSGEGRSHTTESLDLLFTHPSCF